MSKIKIFLILVVIFFAAIFLRVMFLGQNALTFGYDQARDAYMASEILRGDIKIQGPPSSTPGLFHGVLYYYLLAPLYGLGRGSPVVAAYGIAVINAATVFIIFLLASKAAKNIWVGLLAALLFMVSFESTQYATWLSNPTTAIFTVPLTYLGLWLWTNSKSKWAPALTVLGLGLSIQAEIFLGYHIIPIAIWLFAARKSITKKQLAIFAAALLFSLSTMILSEIKFGFKGIEGLKLLISGGETNLAYAKSIGDYLILYLNQAGRIFAFNSYPGNIGYGGGFILILAIYSLIKKDRVGTFLSSWLFAHLSVVTMGGTSTPFLMVGIGPAVSIIMAYFLVKWWNGGYKLVFLLTISILIYGNVSYIFRENPRGATLFAIQKDMILSKQIPAVDFTYQKSAGAPFSLNSLTSPLFINITWSYLYEWYGKSTYGYVPEWHGRDQVGQLGTLPELGSATRKAFLILEPMGGIPPQYLSQTLAEENAFSRLVSEQNWGELRVQEREIYAGRYR